MKKIEFRHLRDIVSLNLNIVCRNDFGSILYCERKQKGYRSRKSMLKHIERNYIRYDYQELEAVYFYKYRKFLNKEYFKNYVSNNQNLYDFLWDKEYLQKCLDIYNFSWDKECPQIKDDALIKKEIENSLNNKNSLNNTSKEVIQMRRRIKKYFKAHLSDCFERDKIREEESRWSKIGAEELYYCYR